VTEGSRGKECPNGPLLEDDTIMNVIKMTVLVGGLALWVVACGANGVDAGSADEAVSEPQAQVENAALESSQSTTLAAGPRSAELGLERWELVGNSIKGLNAEGRTLAEFVSHPDEGLIESVLPSAGMLALDVAAATDTFSPEVREYFDALQVDKEVLSLGEGNASVDPSVFISCHGTFSLCNFSAADQVNSGLFSFCTCNAGTGFPCNPPFIRLDCF
jgi:hypothetical protein